MWRIFSALVLSTLSMIAFAAKPDCNSSVQHVVNSSIIKYKIGYLVSNSNYIKACSISFSNYDSTLNDVISDDMDICDMAKSSQRTGDIVSIHYCYTGKDSQQQPLNINPRIMNISTQNEFTSSPESEG
ncbi:hypothetical protein [Enterobacter bugandensis]|uniref:hypothetical protein n=1 Tax=Enterobacter bugandensis TaxID=881260 RepID=UPI0022E77714|nr:hypothetical protein [Enterobacter bugandensis]